MHPTKYSVKNYRCAHCGTESKIGTNHYGEVYSRCDNWKCVSRLPIINGCYKPPRHVCIVPAGGWVPEPWKEVRLGDIAEIIIPGSKA